MKTKAKWYIRMVLISSAALFMQCCVLKYYRPSGKGPAGPDVSKKPFEKVWSDRPVVLLGIGDSITRGYGADRGRSFFEMLVKNHDEAYPKMKGIELSKVFPSLTAENLSVNYTVSAEHLAKQVPSVKSYPEEVLGVAVITSGGNDLIHNYGFGTPRADAMYGCTIEQARKWQPVFKKRLEQIIGRISEKFPGGCEIFLANIYDPTDGVGDIENAMPFLSRWPDGLKTHALWNETIAQVSEENPHVHLVDIHSVMLGHGIHCEDKDNRYYCAEDPCYWYYINLEDPNNRGYDAIRRVFLLKMAEVFADEAKKTGRAAEDEVDSP